MHTINIKDSESQEFIEIDESQNTRSEASKAC